MQSINPATEQVIAEYPDHSQKDVERLIVRSRQAFALWRSAPLEQRRDSFLRLAYLLRDRRDALAALMTHEMGKIISGSEAEIDKCAWACEFFAENAERFLRDEEVESDAKRSLIRYEPLGPIFAIMPWNFPFWQVFRFAAAALMAGNVALLKHAESVPGCALEIETLFEDAGFPPGVFTTLMITRDGAEMVIRHPLVAAITLTGSDRAGRAVASVAGQSLKKCVMELGGSDPFIVLADADPHATAEQAVAARCINSGQSCIAAKRFIVDQSIADAFEQTLVDRMKQLVVGDPLDRETAIGPLARLDLLKNLHRQVEQSRSAGAKLVTGGKRLDQTGFFYAPTVLLDVRPGMPAFDEETFGPVAAVTRARDADEAIALANRSRYGLGASLWTDPQRAMQLASRIEAGSVFINGMVKSDPRLPFGGIKDSGYGRELGAHGVREFCNIKTVWVG